MLRTKALYQQEYIAALRILHEVPHLVQMQSNLQGYIFHYLSLSEYITVQKYAIYIFLTRANIHHFGGTASSRTACMHVFPRQPI